jgi:hypothetical protein
MILFLIFYVVVWSEGGDFPLLNLSEIMGGSPSRGFYVSIQGIIPLYPRK